MKEIWKDIIDYEGMYQVSSLGRVKSLNRYIETSRHFYELKGRILKSCLTAWGYTFIALSKKYKSKTFYIHKLVAIYFLGHKPCGHKLVVHHKDKNRANNKVNNLEIVTQRQNTTNTKKNKSSKYAGISYNKKRNRWTSSIRLNGKAKYLGSYIKEYDAAMAYKNELDKI